jgi:DNA-binding MarR family transcriptional regulator
MQSDFKAGADAGMHTELEVLFEETVDLANCLKSQARRTHRGEVLSASGRILLQSLQLHGQQTVPALAHIRSTSRQNIQVLVDRLADSGYVGFVPNPGHKRSDLVALTEAGRALLASANAREASALETLLPHTTEAAVKAAAELLRKLRLLLGGERKRRKAIPAAATAVSPAPAVGSDEEMPVSLL